MKNAINKVWEFLKKFWQVILLVVSVVGILLFSANKSEKVSQLLEEQEKTRKQLEELRKIQEEERRAHIEIERKYQETIALIEKNHKETIDKINEQQQTELRQIITETRNDPQAMAERINNAFGIPIYH